MVDKRRPTTVGEYILIFGHTWHKVFRTAGKYSLFSEKLSILSSVTLAFKLNLKKKKVYVTRIRHGYLQAGCNPHT